MLKIMGAESNMLPTRNYKNNGGQSSFNTFNNWKKLEWMYTTQLMNRWKWRKMIKDDCWRNAGVWSWGSKTKGKTKQDLERGCQRVNCQARKLNKENAMDRCKWRKLIKDVRWSGWVWVGECFFWYRPTRVVPNKRPLNSCVCVCARACVCV